jgi:hypothetical protein
MEEFYMPYDPERHHRRSIRLKGYDYSQAGAYAVTLVSHEREGLFGEIVDGQMALNAVGEVIAATWRWLAVRYPYVALDAWVVMPNHLHGIIVLAGDDRRGEEAGGEVSLPRQGDAPASSPLIWKGMSRA